MDTKTIYQLTFRGTLFFTLVGVVLGLLGIWLDDFWNNDLSGKLLLTTFVLFSGCFITAGITKGLVMPKDKQEE